MKKFKEFIKEKSDDIICLSAFIGMVLILVWLNNTNQCVSDIDMPTTTETTTVETTTAAIEENTTLNVELPVPAEPETIIKTTIRYDVPIDDSLQKYIINLCEERNIAPGLVFAVIEKESDYNALAIGDNGKSFGLMQIQKHHHLERMEKLGAIDLLNPYDNVVVGIDILAEKLNHYNTVEKALTAYNAGDAGARKHYFSKGIYANNYAKKVVEIWKRLEVN